MSISQLKSFDEDRYDLEELVALSAEGKALQAEFAVLGAEVPEWLSAAVRKVALAIDSRLSDQLQKRLRAAKARVQALKPASERRAEAEAEIQALEARLNK